MKRVDAAFKKSTEVAAGGRQRQSTESNGASGDQRGVLGEKGKNIYKPGTWLGGIFAAHTPTQIDNLMTDSAVKRKFCITGDLAVDLLH